MKSFRLPHSAFRISPSFALGLPARHQRLRHAKVIQDPGHHRVHDLLDRARPRVEGRIGRNERRAGQQQQLEIPDMHQAHRRFARHEDEPPALLQHHIRRPQQDILAQPVGNPSQRAHRAGNDHHRVERIRAAGERHIHALQAVRLHPRRQTEAGGQFLAENDLRVIALHDVNLVRLRIEIVEQPLRIERPAGTRDGHEYSHARSVGGKSIMLPHYGRSVRHPASLVTHLRKADAYSIRIRTRLEPGVRRARKKKLFY